MLNSENGMVILGVCAIVLIIVFAKRWMSLIVSGVLRAITGAAGIYLLNILGASWNISLSVGINLFNLLVVGILGLPGFGLLYAISALEFF